MKLLISSVLVAASAVSLSVPLAAQPAPAAHQVAQAQQPASPDRLDLARRFVSLTLSPDKFIEMVHAAAASMIDGGGGCGCGEDSHAASAHKADAHKAEADKAQAQRDLDHFLALLEPKLRARLPKLTEAYAAVYARDYSADELQQMVSFAQSPAGAHYLANRLDVETDPAVQKEQQGFLEDFMPAMIQFQKDKCVEHTAQRIASGDTTAKCALASEPDAKAG